MEEKKTKKVSLIKTILFTVCSILVLDSFVAPTLIGVSSISIWIITAIFFFVPYGLLSAELGSTYPDDGGITSWVNRGLGEFWGVMEGWMYWINVAFWMPAVFIAFADWISFGFFAGELAWWVCSLIAVAMTWVIVVLGILGVELSVNVASIMAYVKMGVLVLFGILGVWYGIKSGFASDFSFESWIPAFEDVINFEDGGYFAAIVYNLLGFELIGSIGNDIEDPKKTVPKMTIIAGIAIVAIYCIGSFGVLAAVDTVAAGVDADTTEIFVTAVRELCSVFGPLQDAIFYILLIASISTLVANMITWCLGANESFMAADLDKRVKFLGHRNKKYGTPDVLYIIMGVVSSILAVMSYALYEFSEEGGDVFWTVFAFSSIVFMLCYIVEFVAAVVLKFKDKTERVYAVPGGKVGFVICAVLCFLGVGLAILSLLDLDPTGYGFWLQTVGLLLTFAAGVGLYFAGKKKPAKAK